MNRAPTGPVVLRDHPLFQGLSPEELEVVFSHEHVSAYPKGQVVFYEGNRPTGLYFLVSGKAKVCKKGLWNNNQIVRLAKPGDLLTLRALGGVSHYAVSAVTLEDSQILFLDTSDFFSVLKANASFACRVVELLAVELDEAEKRICDLAQKNVRQRLAASLLNLHDTYGERTDGLLGVRLLREDLANLIGTAVETTVRFLAEFRSKGLIAFEGRNIRIVDHDRLEKAAQPDRGASPGRVDKNQASL